MSGLFHPNPEGSGTLTTEITIQRTVFQGKKHKDFKTKDFGKQMLGTAHNRNCAKFRVCLAPRITEPDLIPVGIACSLVLFYWVLISGSQWKLSGLMA